MVDLLPYYGIEMDRSNFCKCPFHQEKSASFKAYDGDRGYYCYGCHTSGSVIDFVMQYFSIPFVDAIKKINEDFSLGLPIGEKLDRRKQLEMQKQAFLRKREMNARKAKQEELEKAYWAAFDEWKRLDDNKRNYAPKTPSEPLHPLFVPIFQGSHIVLFWETSSVAFILFLAEFARILHNRKPPVQSAL